MNKKIVFCLAMLMNLNVFAMQQQQQRQKQEEQDQQKQKDKKKPRWYSNDNQPEQPITDPEIDNLHQMISGIVNQINQGHGSVTKMVENLKHKEHKRICPTCGRPAQECHVDRDRVAHGEIMLCGCPVCGGLLV